MRSHGPSRHKRSNKMSRYVTKRLLQALIIVFFVSLIIFVIINLAPGDPYTQKMDPSVSAERKQEILQKMGYYDPIHIKYIKWVRDAIQGDFGYSIKYKKPVFDVIMDYLPNTLLLGGCALLLSTVIAIPAGITSSTKRNSLFDYAGTIFSFIGISIPAFFFGLLMIKWLAFDLRLFPISGMVTVGTPQTGWSHVVDVARHLVLPTIVLALLQTATLMRYTRSSMLEVYDQDYIRTARAKGLPESTVIHRHAFKNALIPIITVLSIRIPTIFSGAVLTETIFVWPGIGRLSYQAILDRDYPLIMALLLMTTVMILLCNLIADILYAFVDPRVRYE